MHCIYKYAIIRLMAKRRITVGEQLENLEIAITRSYDTMKHRRYAAEEPDLKDIERLEHEIEAEKAENAMNGYLESYGDVLAALGERAVRGH